MSNNYIDTVKLHNLLMSWKEDRVKNIQMSNELGKMFLLIIDGILRKPKFIKIDRDLKDELKSVALENLVKYIHAYNPDNAKSKNPAFTYVTFCSETAIRGHLQKINQKKERLPIIYDTDVLLNMDIAAL